MSLASIKQKEVKGKKKVLPKLRNILANPYKQHSPLLSEEEVQQFRQILQNAVKNSGGETKSFATRFGIHLGLESSLRAINSRRFSCLLVSLSLRPAHLVRLMATSASVKMPTAPIYAQPKLEELTHEIFGVRALSLALPLDLKSISADLEQWITARKRTPKPAKQIAPKTHKKSKRKPEIIQPSEDEKKPPLPVAEKKDWGDDFISCFSDKPSVKLDRVDVQVETQKLGHALSNLAMKAQSKKPKVEVKCNPVKEEKTPSVEPLELEPDEDDFLPGDLQNYRHLTIHQVRPNPDKKPKKKRNKKATKS
ncbi:uncharacterized protein LOC6554321 [Drosophila erecta]|uniref:GG12078 n=1 Tax=Drosophila erecta TaxID=7220 RepID=B3P5V0_DROER|nr:uncharacterized protein LOC6554321 [Drosophila erecta]EDV53350.1 uncharacterized protein Dere_GG12078 [Drosophila erecta]